MAKVLANETKVTSMLQNNAVVIEVGGSVRRIELKDFIDSINQGDELMLRQVAWGVPIKDKIQSSPNWGRIGNLQAWEEYKLMSGRYLVTNDGRAAKLNPVNSAIYADGTALDESKGHIMVVSPRLYYRMQEDSVTGVPVLWMSQLPIGGHYISNPGDSMYNCIAAYKGSMVGSALVSRSGVPSAGSRNISQFWAAARVNGSNWGLTNYDHRKLMLMLGLSEYGNPNIQDRLGYGVSGSVEMNLWDGLGVNLLTGATKNLGDGFGKNNITLGAGVDCSRVNLMGYEDPYGWQWEMVQNIYFGSSANAGQTDSEAFIYEGNRMPTAAELTTAPTGQHRKINRHTTSGYIQEMLMGQHADILPSRIGGNSTSHWCDYYWGNTAGQLCLVGGDAYHGSQCGLGIVYSSNAFSFASSTIGSRLANFGKLTFVNGTEIN